MPTSVHIPPALLEAVDKKARALKISRNKLIVHALEKDLEGDLKTWPAGFFDRLRSTDRELEMTVDEMVQAIYANRRSRAVPPTF